mmetsp:Transcript_19090/g.26714  ORF Transcript_19090/g.26714 Transcript_19090/m.26714 type:complete len:234 (-) Transcript_19090:434-1135(-)
MRDWIAFQEGKLRMVAAPLVQNPQHISVEAFRQKFVGNEFPGELGRQAQKHQKLSKIRNHHLDSSARMAHKFFQPVFSSLLQNRILRCKLKEDVMERAISLEGCFRHHHRAVPAVFIHQVDNHVVHEFGEKFENHQRIKLWCIGLAATRNCHNSILDHWQCFASVLSIQQKRQPILELLAPNRFSHIVLVKGFPRQKLERRSDVLNSNSIWMSFHLDANSQDVFSELLFGVIA